MTVRRDDNDSGADESFAHSVLACVADLNTKVLPRLTSRYDSMVVVSALAEHVGSALRILLQRQIFDEEEARQVIARIRETASLGEKLRRSRSQASSSTADVEPDEPGSE